MPTATKLGKRICKHSKCQRTFKQKRTGQEYCNRTCKNRAAQERLRERAKINGNYKGDGR